MSVKSLVRLCAHATVRGGIGLIAVSAYGQSAPSQADLEEQRRRARGVLEEREQRQRDPDVRLLAPPIVARALLPNEVPCFPVRALRLGVPAELAEPVRQAGAHERPGDPFHFLVPVLSEYVGGCVGRAGLDVIVKRLSSLIVARGYVTTRLGIPEQDLASGTLRFALIPGVIRAIRFADETPAGDWRSAFPVRPGDLLNLREIEQGLEHMKRVPSQEADIQIVPGETPGESDVVITIKRVTPWRVGISLDDSGSKATGKHQASLNLAIDNPLGLNDLLSVGLNSDAQNDRARHGTRGRSFQYSLPWGYWTLSLSSSDSHYHQLVKGTNQTFASSGDSVSQEMKLQRVVHRDQTAKTSLQFRVSRRFQRSYIDDTEIVVQRRRTTAAELGVTHRQQLGPVQLDVSLARREGVRWLDGQGDAPDRAAGSPTNLYRMHIVDIGALAPFKIGDQQLRWIGAFHGQTTRDVLYATDQIAIGNRYTVRGFDGETTLAAERGSYLRNELELMVGGGHAIYVGLDQGRVGGPSAGALVGRSLAGTVVGVRGSVLGITYDLFSSRALRKPEGFTTTQPAVGFQLGYQF